MTCPKLALKTPLRFYVESRKMVEMNLSAKQKWRHKHREQSHGYQGGRGGGRNWEIGIDIDTLLCIKEIANENLPFSTGDPTQCSVLT